MVYIFRSQASESARELVNALQGRRAQLRDRLLRRLRRGDQVVCWGERLAPREGIRILNGGPLSTKFEDAIKLRQENVPTIEVARTAPPRVDRITPIRNRAAISARGLADVLNRDRFNFDEVVGAQRQLEGDLGELRNLRGNAGPTHEWLGRLNHHIGGADLLEPPTQPDYFVKKENLVREFRIHSFLGRSIRSGQRIPRDGAQSHPWIRSMDAGWRISYGRNASPLRQAHRDLAHSACRALGLDFGAVDIGQKADGGLIVLEVNRAPGIEAGTTEKYSQAIRGWMEGI